MELSATSLQTLSTCSMLCLFLLSIESTNACCPFRTLCFGGRRNFCGSRRRDAMRYKYFLQIKHLYSGSRVLSVCLQALRQPFSSFLLLVRTYRPHHEKDSLTLRLFCPICLRLLAISTNSLSEAAFSSLIISAQIMTTNSSNILHAL